MREVDQVAVDGPLTWACLICGEVHAIDHAALWTADGAFAICLGCEPLVNARAASPRVVGRVFTKLYGLDARVEADGNRVVIETSFGRTDPGEPSPDRKALIMSLTPMSLTPIKEVRERHPWWPFSPWSTWVLIRDGKLGSVTVGRRRFVSEELLRQFVADHTKSPGGAR